MPNSGELNVTELYGEAEIPLIQDRPWIKSLSLDTGYRASKYSSGGGWVSTYKAELQYAPTEDIRPRVSYNRAVRSANVTELYAGQSLGNVAGDDPCAGSSPTASLAACQRSGVTQAQYGHIPQCPADVCVTQGGGNPRLAPEVAKTYTIGAVMTPRIVPALSMTVDYYNIKVDKYIKGVDASLVINQCIENGNSYFCGLFHRDPSVGVLFGNSGYIVATNQNTGYLSTSGIDVSTDYKLALADLVGSDLGRLDFSLVGTFLLNQITEPLPGLGTYDCRGLFGVTCGQPVPMWRHQLRTTWTPPWLPGTLSLNWRYIGSVKNEKDTGNQYLASDYVIANKQIKAYSYIDLAVTGEITKGISARAGVNNLFDKDPPAIATSSLGTFANGNTYPGVYDPLGRTIFMGVTAEF